jgi:hypothetical protein
MGLSLAQGITADNHCTILYVNDLFTRCLLKSLLNTEEKEA